MAAILDLIEDDRLFAPGAPEQLLVGNYRIAARHFCFETRAWSGEVGVSQGATTDVYDLAPPSGAEVFDTTFVRHKKKDLAKATREQLLASGDLEVNGRPGAFFVSGTNELTIARRPDTDVSADLTVIANLQPTTATADFPDKPAQDFGRHITLGMLWRVLRMPGTAWHDVSMAEYYRKLFEEQIRLYRSRGADGLTVGVPRATGYGGY